MRATLKDKNKILYSIIKDTLWMSLRYSHGRHTYAPSIIRDVVKQLKEIYPSFKLKKDITIEAPTHELKGMDFRSDYLDDLFE